MDEHIQYVYISMSVRCVIRVVPYNGLHSAHQLFSTTLSCVYGGRGCLVQMVFSRGSHLTVVVDVATLAITHRPVAMVSTAAG